MQSQLMKEDDMVVVPRRIKDFLDRKQEGAKA